MSRKTYTLLVGLFLLSILIRLPNLDRPVSKHHEFCTAITLIPLQNWYKNGAATYHYSPSVSYDGAANLHIENLTAYPVEENGRYYYLSHPPLVYLLPHAIFSTLRIPPSPLGLQLINLFFHLLSCIFIYKIILLLTGETDFSYRALTGFLVYLLAPVCLWFHGNVFMADMFVSNVLIAGLYVALLVFRTSTQSHFISLTALLGLLIFATIYTEWIGNFFAFGVFVLAILKIRKEWRYSWVVLTSVLAVLSGLGLIFWQYSSIAGFETYLAYFEHRFFARGFTRFTDEGTFSFLYKYAKLLKGILKHYAIGFLPVLLLGGMLFYQFSRTSSSLLSMKPQVKNFLWLAGFPILMHQLIFIEYTVVHDFAVLKGGILIAVGLGYWGVDLTSFRKPVGIAMIATFLLCIGQYYFINRPGEINQNGDRYDMMMKLGEAIKENTTDDEVIFLNGYKPEPQVMYYAGRNMLRATDIATARKILAEREAQKGVLFTINHYKIENIERVVSVNK